MSIVYLKQHSIFVSVSVSINELMHNYIVKKNHIHKHKQQLSYKDWRIKDKQKQKQKTHLQGMPIGKISHKTTWNSYNNSLLIMWCIYFSLEIQTQ